MSTRRNREILCDAHLRFLRSLTRIVEIDMTGDRSGPNEGLSRRMQLGCRNWE